MVFSDRVDAGRRLASRLQHLRQDDVVVLGLPRGGVPVAYEVAMALRAPLDVIVVRKLGVPYQPELAMGAIGEGGARVLDSRVLAQARVSEDDLRRVETRERAVLEDRVTRLRRGRDRIDLHGRVAVVVDDGIATGSTARVACEVARHLGAARVVLAVPVGPADTVRHLPEADEVICVTTPLGFMAVGNYYRDFSPTSDEEVIALLDAAARHQQHDRETALPSDSDTDVQIDAGGVTLAGHLHLPERASAVVLFAHGSGSSRHSPRNRFVASVLFEAGIGTLLLDLLTPEEELDRANVFDIPLLAARLLAATRWLSTRDDTAGCRIGYFGASTGAGAALVAAAQAGDQIAAVVSRGGRPDLAGPHLGAVTAPTLLIVGGEDLLVLDLNRQAKARLRCTNRLSVVPGATHLFEEPGTLAEAALLARDWFARYLLPAAAVSTPERAE
ncbi:phosphoribosyltransferase family protein [Microlunatus panaciterrae]|uniref:Phosphoribosyl transferase n=1 Tax=Microlunatus panaciterrae TaxID=400768 RepID=A0ABS2RN53_9ACTN|nr:phosphoribosyltransferase family protein [Microlunatus panaciterrae]MBM7800007.1 putative phosphoribosyl transferase [Microlunatus panaciterrae]